MLTRMSVEGQLSGRLAYANLNVIVMIDDNPTAQVGETHKPSDFGLFVLNAKDPTRKSASFLTSDRPGLLAMSGDGYTVAGLFQGQKNLAIWDFKDATAAFQHLVTDEIVNVLQPWMLHEFRTPIDEMALDWHGSQLAVVTNGNLYVMDLATKRIKFSNDELPYGNVMSLEFSDAKSLTITIKPEATGAVTQFITLE